MDKLALPPVWLVFFDNHHKMIVDAPTRDDARQQGSLHGNIVKVVNWMHAHPDDIFEFI
jgi:hypothetical protein